MRTNNLYRCQQDGKLVTDEQLAKGQHCGHMIQQPVQLTLLERILLWLRK